MTNTEMKKILADKLKDENTYFTTSDISLSKYGKGYKIILKDYEHIIFIIKFENDEMGEDTTLWMQYKGESKRYLLNLEEGHSDKEIKDTLIYLGYYIGTRF